PTTMRISSKVLGALFLICVFSPFTFAAARSPQAAEASTAAPGGRRAHLRAARQADSDEARERNERDTAKRRQQWFYGQRAYPLQRIPPGMRLRALEQRQAMEREALERAARQRLAAPSDISASLPTITGTWQQLGPQPTTPFGDPD